MAVKAGITLKSALKLIYEFDEEVELPIAINALKIIESKQFLKL